MKLTNEQQRVFDDWIRRKIEHPTCQLCQSNHWRTGELLVPADRDAAEPLIAGMVQLVCQNCGQVLLFDASRIAAMQTVDGQDLM